MAIYFASDNTADGSRDGSSGHPYLDPSELPSPWELQSGTEYLFRCDTETNFLDNFRSLTETAAPIVVGSWGSGAKPIITAYRMLAANECVEVAVDNSLGTTENGVKATLTLQAGTHLWRVPKTFFGLFGDGTWGVAVDPTDRAGYGKFLPTAAREWCGSVTNTATHGIADEYAVIYSVGNPVDAFGGVYVSSFPEGTWGTQGYKETFSVYRPKGGYEISGLELREMYYASICRCAGPPDDPYVLDMARVSSNDLRLIDLYNGVGVVGGYEYSPNVRYTSLRHYDCYGENIGNSFFNTSGPRGMRVNDARIYRHVVNGCTKSYGSGGFYIPSVMTDDGSRVIVEDSTVYGAEAGGGANPYWPTDGHAFYQELWARDLEWRRCVSWGSRVNFIGNGGSDNNVWTDCVAVALPPVSNGGSHFAIELNDGTAAEPDRNHRGLVQGMIAVGFQQFAFAKVGSTAAFKLRGNISLGSGQWAGENAYTQAVEGDGHDPATRVIDGNNFYGHSHGLRDWNGSSYDSAPEVTNKITASPAAEIARLPRVLRQAGVTPTEDEKRVNYALQIRTSNRIKAGGVVDLRPGTRVVV